MMKRLSVLLYGTLSYTMFFGIFLYLIGWVGNFGVPSTMDGPAEVPLAQALITNLALLLIFGFQHSVMARPNFKKVWTKFVPKPIERSTYVLFTNIALLLFFFFWEPIGGVVWDVQDSVGRALLYGLFAFGWLTILATTFLINHFDLFGLRQVWLYFRGIDYFPVGFRMPFPYTRIRHPLYVGWLCAFWFTPTMTIAHALFSTGMAIYIMIAIHYEERDLIKEHPEYAVYRSEIPMFIPTPGRRAQRPSEAQPQSNI